MNNVVYLRPMVNTGHKLPRGGGRCDFCAVPAVSKLHACKNFVWEGQSVFSTEVGRWAACYLCSSLIGNEQWIKLSNRVMREIAKRKGIDEEQLKRLRKSLRGLHKGFSENVMPGESFEILTPRYRTIGA